MLKKTIWFIVAVLSMIGCTTNAIPAASSALSLTPPWKGDEHFEYNLVSSTDGSPLGSSTIDVKPATDATTIEEQDKVGNITQHSVVKVNPQNLTPLSSEKQVTGSPNDFSLTATYQAGKLAVTAKTAQGDKSATVDVAADAVDNDSVLMVLRAAPLATGYSASFTTVLPANATQVKSTATVTGEETIAVPLGTFETYKVELGFATAKQAAWYEVAAPHRLIQYDNGTTKFVLVKSS